MRGRGGDGNGELGRFTAKPQRAQRGRGGWIWVLRRVIKRGCAESAEGSAKEKRFTAKPQRAQRGRRGEEVYRKAAKGAEGARRMDLGFEKSD